MATTLNQAQSNHLIQFTSLSVKSQKLVFLCWFLIFTWSLLGLGLLCFHWKVKCKNRHCPSFKDLSTLSKLNVWKCIKYLLVLFLAFLCNLTTQAFPLFSLLYSWKAHSNRKIVFLIFSFFCPWTVSALQPYMVKYLSAYTYTGRRGRPSKKPGSKKKSD